MIARKRNILRSENISVYSRCTSVIRSVFFICLFFFPAICLGQNDDDSPEEILVSVGVQGAGITELPAVISGTNVYLPIVDLFDYLKIKNTSSAGLDSISGFLINESARFTFNAIEQSIFFNDKKFDVKGGLIRTETGLYVDIKYLGEIFGMESKFNFRALLVNITTVFELPVVREARLIGMRNNINRLKGDIVADTVYRRTYPAFRIGMLDWSVVGSEQVLTQGKPQNDVRMGLGLGGVLAGGETNVILNYNVSQPFDRRRQYYLWRLVDNEKKYVKQAMVGKIPVAAISSIFAPIVGVQFTNTSTVLKRAFGTYTLSNVTEPGWIVELYLNGVLIDYLKADASGFYSFQVPLIYGTSVVKLKFYGPYGEERSKEESINVPLNFLPKGEFEYTAGAGVLENDSSSVFSKGVMNYGLTKRVTVGTGVEYLSTVRPASAMPFLNMAARLGTSVLIGGEYTYKVRTKTLLSYRSPANFQVEMMYTKFQKGQTAFFTNSLEERRAIISTPIRALGVSMFSMLTTTQNILATSSYINSEWLMSGLILGMNTNISTYGVFIEKQAPFIYSNISLGHSLPRQYSITAQGQYDFSNGGFISSKVLLEKRISRMGYASIAYDRNFRGKLDNLGVQFRYDLAALQVGLSAYKNDENYTLQQSFRGGILFDDNTNYVDFRINAGVGRGAIVIAPFLDLNCDGKLNAGEPKVSGLKFRISAGRVQPEGKDSTIRVLDLDPYAKCMIELNRFSFDNIAWQIRNKTIALTVEPNVFTRVEVPVAVVGEANGMVYITKNGEEKGQGQIIVGFYKDGIQVAKTLTEPDGYFSYIGLIPGDYTVEIDRSQLERIKMKSSAPLKITIVPSADGDIAQGLEFRIQSLQK